MVEVTLKRTRKQQVEETVEVDFPVYVEGGDDLDDGRVSYSSHYRISADGQRVAVQIWSGHDDLDYEVRVGHISIAHDLDAYLNPTGLTWRKSTAKVFDQALSDARAALAKALTP